MGIGHVLDFLFVSQQKNGKIRKLLLDRKANIKASKRNTCSKKEKTSKDFSINMGHIRNGGVSAFNFSVRVKALNMVEAQNELETKLLFILFDFFLLFLDNKIFINLNIFIYFLFF